MRMAVAGGTGRIGRLVMDRLRERGHSAVSLSRAEGVDLETGTGLGDLLTGVDAVIDVTNPAVGDEAEAVLEAVPRREECGRRGELRAVGPPCDRDPVDSRRRPGVSGPDANDRPAVPCADAVGCSSGCAGCS